MVIILQAAMQFCAFSINVYFNCVCFFLTIELCKQLYPFILYSNSAVMFSNPLFKDARYFQIIFQSIFLSYGIFVLHWRNESWLYATYFITSLAVQFVCEYFFGKTHLPFLQRFKNGIPSVLISSFGLSLLLKTNYWWVGVLAATVSILSKYILRINGKHIFNPSALGIVVVVLVTGNAWISPGQWGSGAVIIFGVLSLGFIVV